MRKEQYAKGKESGEKISYLSMYKGKYLWIGLGTILLSGANFTAYSAFSNNATTYLVTGIGMTAATAGAIYSMQGTGQLVGYIIWGLISDKFGRKVPAIGMALSAVAVFHLYSIGWKRCCSVLYGFCFAGLYGWIFRTLGCILYRAVPREIPCTFFRYVL